MIQKKIYIYGKHAVAEALAHAPRALRKVYLAPGFDDAQLRAALRASGIPQEPLEKNKVSSMVEGNAPHQGVVALVSLGSLVIPAEKYLDTLAPHSNELVVLLSEVQDPHNVGAIIRSAVAFGASAVILPTHKQAPVSGAVIKASAGTAFQIPLVSTDNMQQMIANIKKKGFQAIGLAADAAEPIAQEAFSGPTLLIFGNEAQGVAPAARALCDKMLNIPMRGGAESLNVAASAAVALYAWSQRASN